MIVFQRRTESEYEGYEIITQHITIIPQLAFIDDAIHILALYWLSMYITEEKASIVECITAFYEDDDDENQCGKDK